MSQNTQQQDMSNVGKHIRNEKKKKEREKRVRERENKKHS